jgi:hypothetical protein
MWLFENTAQEIVWTEDEWNDERMKKICIMKNLYSSPDFFFPSLFCDL